ncbi:MAG: hypothetical protein NUV67_02140, partial [archaeon]|nr:hypothetical protein [archaeon]
MPLNEDDAYWLRRSIREKNISKVPKRIEKMTIVYWLIFAEIVLFLTSMTNIILVSLAGEILVV